MKITSVSYSRLKTLRGYNNERLGATAEVGPDEEAEIVMAELKDWVEGQFETVEDREDLREEVLQLQWRKDRLSLDIQEAEEQWARAKAFLEKHGVRVDKSDDLPF